MKAEAEKTKLANDVAAAKKKLDDEVAAAKKKLDEAGKGTKKVVSKVESLIPVVEKELNDIKARIARKEKKDI